MVANGARAICTFLEDRGVGAVFGVAGTQNVALFEALRTSRLRTVAAPHETAAGFMAIGYYHSTGIPGVFITIPGPGFTFALPALAEARLDSAAVVLLTLRATDSGTPRFQLQDIPQRAMAAPLVKEYITVAVPAELGSALGRAFDAAVSGEPGPVIVEMARSLLTEECAAFHVAPARPDECIQSGVDGLAASMRNSARIAILAGRGVHGDTKSLQQLAEARRAPVFLTTSARGAISEDSPLAFPEDRIGSRWDRANAFFASCDLVLALGVKLTHNGSGGYRLRIPREKLIHCDASAEVLGANYPARLAIRGDVPSLLKKLATDAAMSRAAGPAFTEEELFTLRSQLFDPEPPDLLEPRFATLQPPTAARFFEILRGAAPPGARIAVDSGMHQLLARKYFTFTTPRSFLVPSDFQSMGFSLAAAMGAHVGAPAAPTIALMGDGGFAMMGLELPTALREGMPIKVVVFNDHQLGLIRNKQLQEFGTPHATEIVNPDFEIFAASLGIEYLQLNQQNAAALRDLLSGDRPALIEVPLGDSPAVRTTRWKHAARRAADATLGARWSGFLRRRRRPS